jgi:hypothetical protein
MLISLQHKADDGIVDSDDDDDEESDFGMKMTNDEMLITG